MNYEIPIVDFETDAIAGNPIIHPPRPVGVSISWPGHPANYFAWGHPTGNNCTQENAISALEQVWDSGLPIGFYNAGFDISVWSTLTCKSGRIFRMGHFDWQRIHDPIYLVFFRDPYSDNFQLKPSAHRLIGIPPDEQEDLRDWIIQNVPGANKRNWGAFISKAPGNLVAPYANGDCYRTLELFKNLYPYAQENGMGMAYERERRLFPVCLAGTRRGMRIDWIRLACDEQTYTVALQECRYRLAKLLSCTPEQVGDEEGYANALERSGAVKEWVLTPKSRKRSMSGENLNIVIPAVRELHEYRIAVEKTVTGFMRPWVKYGQATHRLHTSWNQVRQSKNVRDSKGARTGRLSSDTPALMNVTTEYQYEDGTPMIVPAGLPSFPLLRRYCLPEEGDFWLKRDLSSQEVRLLAHFENGSLATAYRGNPDLDPHQMASDMLLSVLNMILSRKHSKITGFSIIYGTGGPGLSKNLRVPLQQAYSTKAAYLHIFPGVKDLMDDVQARGRAGLAVRTWGGRLYYAEQPKEVDGRLMQFYYKLLNYLIQGSAADQTKDIICDWDSSRDPDVKFILTVHDELDVSAPIGKWKKAMAHMKECMDRDRLTVPMRSEGSYGQNWHALEKCA